MPEIEIRTARQDDLEKLIVMDHSYVSNHVFQMELTQDINSIGVTFLNVRLPRSMNISYPRNEDELLLSWQKSNALFVGCINNEILVYLNLEESIPIGVVKVRDIVVLKEKRRNGIASGMLLASEDWAIRRGHSLIMLEMQTRNEPAINLARKLGYQFCGYQDRYFPNQDMGLFYIKYIR